MTPPRQRVEEKTTPPSYPRRQEWVWCALTRKQRKTSDQNEQKLDIIKSRFQKYGFEAMQVEGGSRTKTSYEWVKGDQGLIHAMSIVEKDRARHISEAGLQSVSPVRAIVEAPYSDVIPYGGTIIDIGTDIVIPGKGEVNDALAILDSEVPTWARWVAGGSLVLGVVTLGWSPNISSFLRFGKKVADDVPLGKLDDLIDASRKIIDDLPANQFDDLGRKLFGSIEDADIVQREMRKIRVGKDQMAELDLALERLYRAEGKTFGGIWHTQSIPEDLDKLRELGLERLHKLRTKAGFFGLFRFEGG